MVSRLNPVGILISFPTGTYHLGDTVSVRVDIDPRMDVTVREARIGMECSIRYTEMRSGISRRDVASRGGSGVLGAAPQTISAPFEVELTDKFDEYAFLTDLRLRAGQVDRSDVLLRIPSKLGKSAEASRSRARVVLSWRIVVVADVSLALDVAEFSPIDIVLDNRDTY